MSRPLPLAARGLAAASPLVFGCMGLGGDWNPGPLDAAAVKVAHEAVDAALEAGMTMFDLADIYRRGKSEEAFGRVLTERPGLRDSIAVQTKVGIRFADGAGPGRYDFSRGYLRTAVEGCLKRLALERIDVLLLHRPDPLMEPGEVAEALESLHAEGKVGHFGVSNMNAAQIDLLDATLDHPVEANQLELSLSRSLFLDAAATVNDGRAPAGAGLGGTVEYCRAKNIQLQAWAPLARGKYSGNEALLETDADREAAALVGRLAASKGVPRESVVLAWLFRHPAGIQAVVGSVEPLRIRACAAAPGLELSREEWYALWVAARGSPLP